MASIVLDRHLDTLEEGGFIRINSNEIQLVLEETPVKKCNLLYGHQFIIKEGAYILRKDVKFFPDRLHTLRYHRTDLTSEFIVHTSDGTICNLAVTDLKYAHLCYNSDSYEIILEVGCDDIKETGNEDILDWYSIELRHGKDNDIIVAKFKF